MKIWKKNWLFWITVVLPTVLAVIYYGFIASDIYISESKFVIRTPEPQTTSPLGVLLKGAGFSSSQDDVYTVQAFMLSRDAMHTLDKKFNLRDIYGKGDVLSSFPGPDWDHSFENMHLYYQRMVKVQLDSASSIGTLRVRAFRAEDAYQINKVLLEMSEALVNKLNERARQDMIHFAQKVVSEAEKKAEKAALALADFRNREGVIDPEKQTEIPLQQIAKLQDELIVAKAQLAQLELSARNNPQIPILKKSIQILEDEIRHMSVEVAGGRKSLATKAVEYQQLLLAKEFADKELASALASLEQARNEAQRQQLYLERIAEPSLPDAAMEPRRFRDVVTVFVLGLILWGVLSMLIAGIREHQD